MSEGGDQNREGTETRTDGYQEHATPTGDSLSQIDVGAVRDLIQQVQWLQLQLKQVKFNLQIVPHQFVFEIIRLALERIKNIVGRGENAGYQNFLLFTQCFQKA